MPRPRRAALAALGSATLVVASVPAFLAPALGATTAASRAPHGPAKHVLLLSVDGMHESDLLSYATAHPDSALAALLTGGTSYRSALTTYPSDSFPGMTAQVTGGSPGTTGVYYDDTWNTSVFPAGTTKCAGKAPGSEVSYTEAADKSQNPITLDAGQGLTSPALAALPTNTAAQTEAAAPALTKAILQLTGNATSLLNPAALPLAAGTCKPVYPHNYVKVNTIFEVARASGLRTAWSDKHPAYELLNGPSGKGIQDLFTPEINSVADASGDDWTKDEALTQEYDGFKVAAVLNEIRGFDHSGTKKTGTPAIFGMNFQSVSVAQKLPVSDGLQGGYLPSGKPAPLLAGALDYVDAQVGQFQAALQKNGLAKATTIVLSAKHGQAPENLSALRRVDDGAILAGLDAAWAAGHPGAAPLVTFSVDDDGMLVWLSDHSPAAQSFAKGYLLSHSAPANVSTDPKGTFSTTVTSSGLSSVAVGFAADRLVHAPLGSPRVPDVIGIAQYGVVYTGGVAKIAEHGGDNPQDRNVPLVVSGAGAHAGAVNVSPVLTTQIAPSILRLLGLSPRSLDAVRTEGTQVLPGL
jgi:hypothetical protein